MGLPSHTRLDRAALERIIRRAAELQAGEREIGEGLTEDEVLQLGREVGIPASLLRQALMEERTRVVVPGERGLGPWLVGPRRVAAQRTIAGDAGQIQTALQHWMVEGELLQVKRRYPDQTAWEPARGAFASLKRSFRAGGRAYALAEAEEVSAQVVTVDDARTHVRMVADLANTRRRYAGGAAALFAVGASLTGIALLIGGFGVFGLAPVPLAALLALAVARSRHREVARVQVALEQVLDRLEHGDIQLPHAFPGPRQSAFVRIADEIRKALGT